MDRSEVIRLAREADSGFEGGPDEDGTLGDCLVGLDAVERFAALVAAREREACAQILDHNADACRNNSMLEDVLRSNAAAIRARGKE